jgi:DNA-directed RNA polymerase specialized sigma24 family protein
MKSNTERFNFHYSEIERLIERKRPHWTLRAVPSMDFDDVKSIMSLHIFKKIHLYDEEKEFAPWVSTIIEHQFINILRNTYSNVVKPCNKCPANMDNEQCSIYGEQSIECALYKKWTESKMSAYHVKLPLPIENHTNEIYDQKCGAFDLDKSAKILHAKMENKLKPVEWKIYQMIYIQHLSDEEVAIQMGFKTTEKNRTIGYKRIRQIKNSILEKVKNHLQKEGVDYVE